MLSRTSIPIYALLAGFFFATPSSFAETTSSSNKVLSNQENGFNVSSVEKILFKGDKYISKGNFKKAKEEYDKAREASKALLSFYRDISGSFRGLDARIPREMDAKGRETLSLLAKSNLRLAALFRRQNQPEIAVPVLVEVLRLMTPTKLEGQKAYQSLLELGFVDTPYKGAIKSL